MEIQGVVQDIIYQNELNSYTIAGFETDDEEITIVGYLPFIVQGDTLKLVGKFVTHQEYGEQFKIDTFEKMMPQTLASLEQYLSNGTIRGIGPSTAKKIVNTFGDETIYIFKYEPEKLANIKGISKEKAIQMSQDFNENWDVWQIVGYLDKFGIGASNAKKVYKLLGANAIDKIEENPYILIDIARGVDFKQIDKMAIDIGIPKDAEKRIASGIKYSLIRVSYNGHTCVKKENLITFVCDLLGVTGENVENCLINLNVNKEIVIEKQEEGLEIVYLHEFYKAEYNIAERIISLRDSGNTKQIKKFKQELKKIEEQTSIELSEKQKEALEAINENNVCIITGGPGTGKTTIIKSIIDLYEEQKKKVVLCAPTGRAAKRMTEATGKEAKTLHRLLEIGKIEEEGKIESIDYEVAPLDADVIIVDEVSMVDIFIMNYLLKAVYKGTKLILVGDADQLPSVGAGSILQDLINSEVIATVHLDKIFRQAAKSKIIVNAHKVNDGEGFISIEEAKKNKTEEDFFYIKESTNEGMLYQVLSLCKERLENFGNYNFFENIQVLSPTKKGMLGTKELNKALQKELNPESDFKAEKNSMGVIFREQDKVMQIRNNYDIYWERFEPEYENGSGVFNGELGTIEKIDSFEKQVKIRFDDNKVAWYAFSDLDQIEHAYAITIHKAQRK
ncbi:MAG: ATP-dependent RecD-like DNA helicase [Clostridia bacterium]|nr:ATP-dependent RecD-like DNA helicase [Clostridia bacterium]